MPTDLSCKKKRGKISRWTQLSKIMVNNRSFGQSKMTVNNRSFGQSKMTVCIDIIEQIGLKSTRRRKKSTITHFFFNLEHTNHNIT